MYKFIIILLVLFLLIIPSIFADTGSGESAAGSLTSMPPSVPTLDSPDDGATGVLSSDVEWNTTPHAASYHLQVSTISDFNSTITDESGLTSTNYTISSLSGATQYFWHVSATNVAGTSNYSNTWDFTTDASLPVTLFSFSAEPVNTGILLKWATESETDNIGFILERSTPSENQYGWQFIASYQTHNELCGQGNTSTRTQYAFTDITAVTGAIYQYRLSDVDINGNIQIDDVIQIAMPEVPEVTVLEPLLPNPFNPYTKIIYHLSEAGPIEITVFDLMGRKVVTLLNQNRQAGSYNLYWHGHDHAGNSIASGTYLIILKTSSVIKKQKAMLLH